MPRLPRWTAADAEQTLCGAGFEWVRSKGSHRIYRPGAVRSVIPFHAAAVLHPKIVKQVLEAIAASGPLPEHGQPE